jgi:hypothetical protein
MPVSAQVGAAASENAADRPDASAGAAVTSAGAGTGAAARFQGANWACGY